jgi:hypothetical protein
MKRVVVCGGRIFDDRAFLYAQLDALHALHQFAELMQGGNRGKKGKPGADRLAREWAMQYPKIVRWECKAEWKKYGYAAGPMRNTRMCEWKPDAVIAFEGGRGTANMIEQARAAGILVIEVVKV